MSAQSENPTHMVWTNLGCHAVESHLNSETSVHLRCHLTFDFESAKDWNELIDRLFQKGFHLKFDRRRLVLVNDYTGVQLCTCSHLGYGFATIARKLGKPLVNAKTNKLVRATCAH